MREKIVSEPDRDAELATYKRDMTWLPECKKDFMKWYKNTPSGKDSKKVRGHLLFFIVFIID